MTTATTPTLAVAYDVSGVGPPLVLLHAGVTDRHLWDSMIEPLEVRFTVYRPDLRGFGETRVTAAGEWSLHRDVVDLLDALDIERAHLCGVSIGGAAALNTALESPHRVGGLILINPALYGFSGWGEASVRIDKEIDDALEAGSRSAAATLEMEQWLAGPTRHLSDLDRALVDTMRSMILASYDLDKGGEEQGPDPLPIDRVEEVRARTLVVSGSLDIPEMIAIAELLSERLDDTSLVRLPDTAHLPPFDVPDTLARIVVDFLAA